MNMQTSVKTCFQKFATIKGRATRSEYWWFVLFISGIAFLLELLVDAPLFGFNSAFGLSDLWQLITLIPFICVSIRRLHDIGKSGWWMLLWLFPLIGWAILIVFHCIDTKDDAENQPMHMDMQTAVITCFKKFLTIEGRATRSEYWWFHLFTFLATLVLVAFVDAQTPEFWSFISIQYTGLWGAITIFPSVCVTIRRLHDTNRNGAWILLIFLPMIGWIILTVFYCLKGTKGTNRFGKDPLKK